MPVGRGGDFTLNGKPFMLARGQLSGRAWQREGLPNAVQPRSTDADLRRNALPAEIDFVATYEDFSGGYGNAYREPSSPAAIHWAQNMEVRFPRQAIHCQKLQITDLAAASLNGGNRGYGVSALLQVPVAQDAAGPSPLFVGRGSVMMVGNTTSGSSSGFINTLTPTGLGSNGTTAPFPFDVALEGGGATLQARLFGRPAIFGSFSWIGSDTRGSAVDPRFWRRDMRQVAANAGLTQSVMPGSVFALAGNRMWRAHGPSGAHINLLQSVGPGADPLATANWGPTFNIGNGQVDVQDMVALDDQLFISTQDGLYAGDTSATFFNVLGDMVAPHPDNGRVICTHDRGIVYPHADGMILYQQTNLFSATAFPRATAREIGPQGTSLRSPLRGRIRAVTSHGGWLYAGLYTGSSGHVIAGRANADGEYVWSPMHCVVDFISSNGATVLKQLFFDSVTSPSGGGLPASANVLLPPRMWITTEQRDTAANFSDGPTWWCPVPPSEANPLGFPSFTPNYMGSARLDFGRDNRGAPETLKVLRRVDVNTDANTLLSGYRYCDVYYTLDGGNRVLLGRAQTSPRTTLYFPSTTGSFTTCYDFEFSVESFARSTDATEQARGDVHDTPVYRSLVAHGAFLSEGSDQITAVVRIADGLRDRSGAHMRSGAQMLADLRGMAGGSPVQLVDLTGATNWVTVQRGVQESETYQQGQDVPEIAATIRMAILSFTSG